LKKGKGATLSFSAARAKHFNFTPEHTKEMPGTNTHALGESQDNFVILKIFFKFLIALKSYK